MNWTALIELLTAKEKLIGHPSLSWLMPFIEAELATLTKEVPQLGVAPPATPTPPAIPSPPLKGTPNG